MNDLGKHLLSFFEGEPVGKNLDLDYVGLSIKFDKSKDGILTLRQVPGAYTEEICIFEDGRIVRSDDVEGYKHLSSEMCKALEELVLSIAELNDQGAIVNRRHGHN